MKKEADMVSVTKEFRAEIAHRLPDYDGPCRFVHGHSYLFQVTVERFAGGLSASGMAVDFKELKEAIEKAIGHWDHSLLLFEKDKLLGALLELTDLNRDDYIKFTIVSFIPTAENMAWYIAEEVRRHLPHFIEVVSVRVWETTTSYAEWRRS